MSAEHPTTDDEVKAALYSAGETLMALRVARCYPAGYRSCMPEYLREPGDKAETDFVCPQPNSRAVSAMDKTLAWIDLLPGHTDYQQRIRRLVLARLLVSPRTGAPVFGWRRLAARFGCSHTHAERLWDHAAATIRSKIPAE